jgi:hypothetical protein
MASIMRLHLQYRLWIAEMNADINVLRIFDDYVMLLEEKQNDADTMQQINNYKERFLDLRNELDKLRHEMHLTKMKLAALSKNSDEPADDLEKDVRHKECKERYKSFRKKFSEIKKEFKHYCDV